MSDFLENLALKKGLDMQALNLGWGRTGINFSADLTHSWGEVNGMLTDLGWESTSTTSDKEQQVAINIGYERSRYSTGQAYTTAVEVVFDGPVGLDELFEASFFPDSLNLPDLDQVIFRFELQKTTEAEVEQHANVMAEFKIRFRKDDGKTYVILGLFQKQTQREKVLRILGGTIYGSGDGLINLGFGQISPLTISVNHPFFLNTQLKVGQREERTTLVGAEVGLGTQAVAGSNQQAFNEFLEEARQSLLNMRVLYSSKRLEQNHLELVNQILPSIHVSPLDPLFCAPNLERYFR